MPKGELSVVTYVNKKGRARLSIMMDRALAIGLANGDKTLLGRIEQVITRRILTEEVDMAEPPVTDA